MLAEAGNILRRAAIAGDVSQDVTSIAYRELLQLPVDLFPYQPLAERIWQLRGNVTTYDAWYVALAEALEVGLATIDSKLAAAPGPRCAFVSPPGL